MTGVQTCALPICVTDSNESKVKSAVRIFLFSLRIDDISKIAQYGRSSQKKTKSN